MDARPTRAGRPVRRRTTRRSLPAPTAPPACSVCSWSRRRARRLRAPPRAQGDAEALALIDRARAHHGSARLDGAEVRFSFRGTPFVLRRDGATFRYARTLSDEQGRTVEEVVDNAGTHRFVDGVEVPLDAAEAGRVHTAVNSVAYFALLPAPLSDPAVRARLLTPDRVGGSRLRPRRGHVRARGRRRRLRRPLRLLAPPDDGEIGHFAYTYEPSPGRHVEDRDRHPLPRPDRPGSAWAASCSRTGAT